MPTFITNVTPEWPFDSWFAVITITLQNAQELLGLMDLTSNLATSIPSLNRLSFGRYPITPLILTGTVPKVTPWDDMSFDTWIPITDKQVQELDSLSPERLSYANTLVEEDQVFWEMHPKHAETPIETPPFYREELQEIAITTQWPNNFLPLLQAFAIFRSSCSSPMVLSPAQVQETDNRYRLEAVLQCPVVDWNWALEELATATTGDFDIEIVSADSEQVELAFHDYTLAIQRNAPPMGL